MGENADEMFGVLDEETDPFKHGRVPMPFAMCVYFAANDYALLWERKGHDFIDDMVKYLRRLPTCTLYAHNGGRFDFQYLVEDAEPGTIEIRNNRITRMRIGRVTLKDSFPLMPFALEEFRKTPINYAIFEANRRNKPENRRRITSYLLDDCRDLFELLTGFKRIVGPRDTIASASFYQMRRMGIKIQTMNETHDDMFRPFYYGGRNQAIQRGIFNGRFIYLDLNSQYPFAMLTPHPHGAEYRHTRKIPPLSSLGPHFIRCIATSRGVLPVRSEDGSLDFPNDDAPREFFATGWEIKAGIQTHRLQIEKVIDVWTPREFINMRPFVQKFYALRLAAKKAKDKIAALAYKYSLNAPYGKYAQNPRDFKEYILAPFGEAVPGFEWETDFGAVSIWSRPSYRGWGFFDVATAASITGLARSILWRALATVKDPLYCDTDSIICRSADVPLGNELGQFKREHAPDVFVKRAAIAGKKLYGVEWSRPDDAGNRYRIASKGARLSWSDILQICRGKEIIWKNDAPTFSIGQTHFIRRRIKAT